jgi:NADPH:quinone reductase
VSLLPTPIPQKYQVLIKVDSAPIHSLDLASLEGWLGKLYDVKYPFVPGIEGSGIVVDYRSGLGAWWLLGKRVAFIRDIDEMGIDDEIFYGGSYSQYAATNFVNWIELPDEVTFKQGATMIYSYLTALGLVDLLAKEKCKSVILTSPKSLIIQSIILLLKSYRIRVTLLASSPDEKESLLLNYPSLSVILTGESLPFKPTHVLSNNFDLLPELVEVLPEDTQIVLFSPDSNKSLLKNTNKLIQTHQLKIKGFFALQWYSSLPYYPSIVTSRWSVMSKIKKMFSTFPKFKIAKEYLLEEFDEVKEEKEGVGLFRPWGYDNYDPAEHGL